MIQWHPIQTLAASVVHPNRLGSRLISSEAWLLQWERRQDVPTTVAIAALFITVLVVSEVMEVIVTVGARRVALGAPVKALEECPSAVEPFDTLQRISFGVKVRHKISTVIRRTTNIADYDDALLVFKHNDNTLHKRD